MSYLNFFSQVEAVIPGCHSNLELETGITLGHVPVGDPNIRNAHLEGASNTLIPPRKYS